MFRRCSGFGLGGVGSFGCISLRMCHSHSCWSNAIPIQLLSLPLGLCLSVVVIDPEVLQVVVNCSRVSSGSRVLIPLTSAFLLVMSTPDFGRGCLTHAVISSFGGCRSGARVILPR